MSNQNEIDYEKQFREDLAKATALSLEQQALDEYNRSKKYEKARSYYEYHGGGGSGGGGGNSGNNNRRTQDEVMSQYYAQLQQRQYSHSKSYTTPTTTTTTAAEFTSSSSVDGATGAGTGNGNGVKRSTSEVANSPTTSALSESDLINFNSPTSQKAAEHQTFEKLIEDLQKLQATSTQPNNMQMALVSTVPPRAVPAYQQQQLATTTQPAANQYGYMPVTPYTGGLQLVPFQMPASGTQTTTPLTNEHLQQLYNMPYGVQHQQQQQQQHQQQYAALPAPPIPAAYGPVMGFVRPAAIVPGAAAAYMPPQYPRPHSYNYAKMQTLSISQQQNQQQQQQQQQQPQTSHSTVSSSNKSDVAASNNNNNNNNSISSNNNNSISNPHNGFKTSSIVNGGAVRKSSRATVGVDLIDLNQDDE